MSEVRQFLFPPFRIDPADERVWNGPVALKFTPKAFAVLAYLVRNAGRLVTKEELLSALWPGAHTVDAVLSVCISEVRTALADPARQPRYIETVHRRGYRFIAPLLPMAQDGPDVAPDAAAVAPPLALPDKPSIAVLAFENMSADPKQEYFADGIAEDIVTTLSKSRWLFVIARNSSFTYKGHAVDVRQIGRELGVRYVLQGSVRKARRTVRITAQLTDAADGHHVWAERYDGACEDIFAVQDRITHRILGAIAPGIIAAEVQRSLGKRASELGQWERLMRARWHLRRFTQNDSDEAIRLLDQLLRDEPDNAIALTDLSLAHHWAHGFGWARSPSLSLAIRNDTARRAVAADDLDAMAHTALAIAEMFSGRLDEAIRRLRRAIELDPNSSFARLILGVACAWGGDYQHALQHAKESIRLSPRDFFTVLSHMVSAWAYLGAQQFEQAIVHARKAIDSNPAFPDSHGVLAAAAAHLGRATEARAAVAEYARLMPGLTLGDERLVRPFRNAPDRERFLAGLRMAGLAA